MSAAAASPGGASGDVEEGASKLKLSEQAIAKLGTLSISALESAFSQQSFQVLDLKDNKISAIPAEIFNAFTAVKVLDLRKNALEELLPDLAVMTSLEDLLLDQNRLKHLPNEVGGLKQLKTLSLSQNVLRSLPESIGRLSQLKSLSLGDNHIEEIPAELGECEDLQTLYFHHNSFTKLPTALHQLKNLSELALEWFRYTTPPLPRVIKGAEWKRIISKFLTICKEKYDKGEKTISCIEVLSLFSQKTFDPNAIDSKRRTRLHVACLEGHVGVAVSLAGTGSKCDSLDCEGYSPLLVAVREEHPDIATALVKVKVDVNRGGGLFGSPLHVATVNFDPHMVLLLIHGKADVNQTDADGNTPLHVLMSVFDKGGKRAGAIGQILLRHGADCNLMNSDKWAPLHLAARRGQLRGICFVLSHIDSVDASCLKGTCQHAAQNKKTKSSRVRTCTRAFDLNLRGGSHLWTPLHLAGHACHVHVVQVLVEAGADVFLRNMDGRTVRHVSRGNLAISKLLRKAEDEWLWHRIRLSTEKDSKTNQEVTAQGTQASSGTVLANVPPSDDATSPPPAVGQSPDGDPGLDDVSLLESLRIDDDSDAIEEIARNVELMGSARPVQPEGEGPPDPGGAAVVAGGRAATSRQMHRIVEKCRDMHFTKTEIHQMQTANYMSETKSIDDFVSMFTKLTQQGPRHRIPFLLSRPWVKALMPQLLEDERCHNLLLQSAVANNEDFIRLLVYNVPKDKLYLFGEVRNKEEETLLHVLCQGSSVRAFPWGATRADILSLLLTVCPTDTFDLEARDLRGQTPLHLAAQSGDLGLVQVLLEYGADPNAQEETTGWTPLHFAVAKAHYSLMLQLLHHDATNVNQADKFDWPPLLEACSRLDARSTSLLVNGKANLGFRNQHQFDVLKAVDTSKKDLAAKRWMLCLLVSNGFRYEESTVQLNQEDRETLERERAFYSSRTVPSTHPPFFVPDHLAPRCHSCKVLFSVTVRRYHCRSCGLVLCGDCFKWRGTNIMAIDERHKSRQLMAQAGGQQEDEDSGAPINESRLSAAVELSMRERGALPSISSTAVAKPTEAPTGGEEEAEDPPFTEVGGPTALPPEQGQPKAPPAGPKRQVKLSPGGLSRERRLTATSDRTGPARMVRLCSSCVTFFEGGVGETYATLERRGSMPTAI